MDGVHFDFALLVALQGEADGHVLGRLHQQRRVFFLLRCRLRCQTSQQLLQVQPRIRIGLGQFFLQDLLLWPMGSCCTWPKRVSRPDRLNDFLFLQRDHAAGPCLRCTGSSTLYPSLFQNRALLPAWSDWARCPSGTMGTPSARAATASASVRTFGGRDELQQLLRIIQPLLELRSQRLRRNLRRDAHVAGQRIGGDELHFVDLDGAACCCQRPGLL